MHEDTPLLSSGAPGVHLSRSAKREGYRVSLLWGDFLSGAQRFSQAIQYVLAVFAAFLIHLLILTKYMGIFNLKHASEPRRTPMNRCLIGMDYQSREGLPKLSPGHLRVRHDVSPGIAAIERTIGSAGPL